jgi:type II secretory ATPase GspE/PulE/Tfp pilus assembly ATPase PilB-like protein
MLHIPADQQSCAVDVVDAILKQATIHHASDIHLEPIPTGLLIRVRIDGVLHDAATWISDKAASVIARIKVLSSMNLAEHRLPQDGKFSFQCKNRTIDVRVSTFPCSFGEKVVLRLLDQERLKISLSHLGLEPQMREHAQELLARSFGFFLVAGPTGSGKTTTLYAALSNLNNRKQHIITLEDPIEYNIPGISQAQIHPEAGFTFEKGIRSLLRQDPDIVMVGEMRDKQTARIAIEAALTGHIVLSTIHAGDAPSVIMRLLDMGIEPFLINAALTGVLAQRLVRRLCSLCKIERPVTAEQQAFLNTLRSNIQSLYHPIGCADCLGTGYKGRIGIFQLLNMSDKLRSAIIQQPKLSEISVFAQEEGMRSLVHDGLDKLRAGIISFEEMIRAL